MPLGAIADEISFLGNKQVRDRNVIDCGCAMPQERFR